MDCGLPEETDWVLIIFASQGLVWCSESVSERVLLPDSQVIPMRIKIWEAWSRLYSREPEKGRTQ